MLLYQSYNRVRGVGPTSYITETVIIGSGCFSRLEIE